MTKVLIIEPYRMVRQAMILTLVPEYEVQLAAALEGTEDAQADVVIVDFAALQENGESAAKIGDSIQHWRMPTVIIEGAQAAEVPQRDGIARLKSPVGKEALKAALAECVRFSSGAAVNIAATEQSVGERLRSTGDTAAREDRATEPKPGVIELTDIVEEKS